MASDEIVASTPASAPVCNATQAAQIGYDIAALLGARLERRHVRSRLGRDLPVLLVRQKMQASVKGLQFEIVFRAAASETAQALALSQS